MNPTAIESHLRLVLYQWALIVTVAWALGRFFKLFGQPLAVGEIVAGLLLGPSGLGAIWPSDWPVIFPPETQQSLQLLAKIGLIFLLFQVGMEFDFTHVKSASRTVVAVSVMGVLAPALLGLAIGPWLHTTFAPATQYPGFQLFVCIALSISALPIMGRILIEMGLERTPMAAIAVSAAALDDVAGWVMLAVATALVTAAFSGWHLAGQIGALLLFFFGVQYLAGPALVRAWRRHGAGSDGQMSSGFLALLLVVLWGCCLATNLLGVFSIFGAFTLGVSLHREADLVAAWRRSLSRFVLVALVPVFFTNTGLRTEITALQTPAAWAGCLVILLAAVGGKLGGCWLGGRWTGLGTRDSACVASLMNTRALMGLVAINIGADLGLLTKSLFTMFVIMALVTTVMTAPLLKWFLPRSDVPAGDSPLS